MDTDDGDDPRLGPKTDPIRLFGELWAEARAGAREDVGDAMTVATTDAEGRPSARVVLLRRVDERGFVFFTNFESRKGREILARPAAALLFHWASSRTQVRVEGVARPVDPPEADAYFASRHRGSQIGAWASAQSSELASREDLLAAYAEAERRFAGVPVPRPPHWSGFRVAPEAIEFWFNRASRLHVRGLFRRAPTGWTYSTLSP